MMLPAKQSQEILMRPTASALRPLLILFLALPAAAYEGTVYEHAKATITAHVFLKRAVPESATYQGPKGHYLLTAEELESLSYVDADSGLKRDIWRFTETGIERLDEEGGAASRWGFAQEACVNVLEEIIGALDEKTGKEQVSEELASRVKALKNRAQWAEKRRKVLAATEAAQPGYLRDPAQLDSLEKEIVAASATVEKIAEAQAEVEPGLERLIAPEQEKLKNPKATFYAAMARALAKAGKDLDRSSAALDALPNE